MNEVMSEIAENKLKLDEWNTTLFISYLGENHLTNDCLVNLKSGKKENHSIFLKVSRTSSKQINKFIQKEYDVLKYLLDNDVKCVPRMVDYGYFNGCAYLAEERINGIKFNPGKLPLISAVQRVKESTNEIYGKTRSRDISLEELLDKAQQYLRSPSEYFELGGILTRLEKTVPKDFSFFPTALVHGNLTSDNVIVTSDGGIKFINFAGAGLDEPPVDIPFLILNSGYQGNRDLLLNPIETFNEYQSVIGSAGVFLTLYGLIRSLSVKTEIFRVLEEELLVRDLRDQLFSSFEMQAILEIDLNLLTRKCVRQRTGIMS